MPARGPADTWSTTSEGPPTGDYCAAMRNGRSVALVSVALLALASCAGGDDDSGNADSPSAATQSDDEAAPAPTQRGGGGGGGGGGLGMGPETFARQLIVALRADSYSVEGNTITMQFEGGSTANGDSQCTIAKATVGNNATVILSYPDGEVPCE